MTATMRIVDDWRPHKREAWDTPETLSCQVYDGLDQIFDALVGSGMDRDEAETTVRVVAVAL